MIEHMDIWKMCQGHFREFSGGGGGGGVKAVFSAVFNFWYRLCDMDFPAFRLVKKTIGVSKWRLGWLLGFEEANVYV